MPSKRLEQVGNQRVDSAHQGQWLQAAREKPLHQEPQARVQRHPSIQRGVPPGLHRGSGSIKTISAEGVR